MLQTLFIVVKPAGSSTNIFLNKQSKRRDLFVYKGRGKCAHFLCQTVQQNYGKLSGGSQKTERVEMLYLLLILFLEHSKVSCEPTLCLFFSNGREVQHNASSAHSAQLFKYML